MSRKTPSNSDCANQLWFIREQLQGIAYALKEPVGSEHRFNTDSIIKHLLENVASDAYQHCTQDDKEFFARAADLVLNLRKNSGNLLSATDQKQAQQLLNDIRQYLGNAGKFGGQEYDLSKPPSAIDFEDDE